MRHSTRSFYLLIFGFIGLISMFSCRKKDERYEGYYVGTERITELDSGATTYSLDTTYAQEIDVTYSKKMYTFIKQLNGPNDVYAVTKKSIVDGRYDGFGEIWYDTSGNEYGSAGYLEFSGDSLHSVSWSSFNGDEKTVEFRGKRN